MSYRNDPYHPDYLKMYPCLKNRPDVLKVLTQSDRKHQQMKFVYSVLKHFAKGTDAVLSYKLCEPFKTMGSVSIEAKRLDFDNPEWFARAAEFASNTEVYPLAKNRIRLTFTFHGITTPIE